MIRLVTPYNQFRLQGVAHNFKLGKGYRIRHFDLTTDQGTYRFKIPLRIHKRLNYDLYPQMELEVSGLVHICPKKQSLKLEVQQIFPTPIPSSDNPVLTDLTVIAQDVSSKAKVLICKKSACWQKGGKEIHQQLQKELQSNGLDQRVQVETTGCMGRCKKGPNLEVLPENAKYSRFQPQQTSQLVTNHFLGK